MRQIALVLFIPLLGTAAFCLPASVAGATGWEQVAVGGEYDIINRHLSADARLGANIIKEDTADWGLGLHLALPLAAGRGERRGFLMGLDLRVFALDLADDALEAPLVFRFVMDMAGGRDDAWLDGGLALDAFFPSEGLSFGSYAEALALARYGSRRKAGGPEADGASFVLGCSAGLAFPDSTSATIMR